MIVKLSSLKVKLSTLKVTEKCQGLLNIFIHNTAMARLAADNILDLSAIVEIIE
jgi:hypothetical protein